MRRWQVWAGVAMATLVLGVMIWFLLAPGWAIAVLRDQAQAQLGRKLEVIGGAHLQLAPALAIRLDGLRLSGVEGSDDAVITATSLTLPVSLSGLLTRELDLSAMKVTGADIGLVISDKGTTSWDFPSPKTPTALSISFERAAIRYFDARNAQAFGVANANVKFALSPEGEASLQGSSEINGRLVRIQAQARSLARIHGQGSPFDLNLEAPDLSFIFNGRLSTSRVLSLTGTAALTGPDIHAALRWTGVDTGREGGSGDFSISGSLDTAGRAFAVKQASLQIGAHAATGSISYDARNAVPKIEAVLAMEALDLDALLPATGATATDWGRNPLGLGALRSLDAAVSISANAMALGGLTSGPSQLAATLADGRLDGRISATAIADGTVELQTTIDASSAPVETSFALAATAVDAARVLPLVGLSSFKAHGNINAAISGRGQTQQEIIGSLKGTADLSLGTGAIAGIDIAALLSAASQRILDGWLERADAQTPFATLTANLSIADGIAAIDALRLEGPAVVMSAKGDVDLLRRALDLRADPRLVSGSADEVAGLPVSLVIAGPWVRPRIYPDVPDILANPVAGFEALKSMGLPLAPAEGN